MPQHTRKPARARAVAVLAAPVLSLGLLAPSASAATLASQQPANPGGLGLCESTDEGFACDLNDIAGLLSGLLNPVIGLTCLNPETNFVICRVNEDNTPFGG